MAALGLEMGGIPVVTMLSQVTGLPSAFLREERKSHGTMKYAEGPDLQGKRILLIEDVVSTGGAIIEGVAMPREDGIAVDRALCVIDRQTGGREALNAIGVALPSLFTMKEIEGEAKPWRCSGPSEPSPKLLRQFGRRLPGR